MAWPVLLSLDVLDINGPELLMSVLIKHFIIWVHSLLLFEPIQFPILFYKAFYILSPLSPRYPTLWFTKMPQVPYRCCDLCAGIAFSRNKHIQ